MGIVSPVDSAYKRGVGVIEGVQVTRERALCGVLDRDLASARDLRGAGQVGANAVRRAMRLSSSCSVQGLGRTGGMVWQRDRDQRMAAARAVCA